MFRWNLVVLWQGEINFVEKTKQNKAKKETLRERLRLMRRLFEIG